MFGPRVRLMAPIQWLEFRPARDVLQQIRVSEPLPAPPICIVQRIGLPLTPAAEYFCDLMRRASAHRDNTMRKRP